MTKAQAKAIERFPDAVRTTNVEKVSATNSRISCKHAGTSNSLYTFEDHRGLLSLHSSFSLRICFPRN
jgi:hypothetical protein